MTVKKRKRKFPYVEYFYWSHRRQKEVQAFPKDGNEISSWKKAYRQDLLRRLYKKTYTKSGENYWGGNPTIKYYDPLKNEWVNEEEFDKRIDNIYTIIVIDREEKMRKRHGKNYSKWLDKYGTKYGY